MGEQLQRARKVAGLTQQELCQKAGLSYSTLAKIERGAIKSPSIFTIQHIAAALGMDLNQLMGDESSRGRHYKRAENGVEFVYFDINGCLVRFFNHAFATLSEDTGLSMDVIERVFWRYNDAICRGEMTMELFNENVAKELGIESLDWKKYYMQSIESVPEIYDMAVKVSKDYRIGLLSNIMPGFIEDMISSGVLPSLDYESIIDSSKVGLIKPNPEIYSLATEKVGVPPEGILLVDDARPNIMSAAQAGWHVIWVDQTHPENTAKRILSMLE